MTLHERPLIMVSGVTDGAVAVVINIKALSI